MRGEGGPGMRGSPSLNQHAQGCSGRALRPQPGRRTRSRWHRPGLPHRPRTRSPDQQSQPPHVHAPALRHDQPHLSPPQKAQQPSPVVTANPTRGRRKGHERTRERRGRTGQVSHCPHTREPRRLLNACGRATPSRSRGTLPVPRDLAAEGRDDTDPHQLATYAKHVASTADRVPDTLLTTPPRACRTVSFGLTHRAIRTPRIATRTRVGGV